MIILIGQLSEELLKKLKPKQETLKVLYFDTYLGKQMKRHMRWQHGEEEGICRPSEWKKPRGKSIHSFRRIKG
ncbi:hypothetical protein Godav_010318, partial [Gossypium davidsonii]|nr:hypothetical protein [Gossypium davidsonii]MBA0660610.1 hypothetical protein [Gossypium klotzschianum]